MRTVTLDGTAIAYQDEGAGLPLLLVHGHPFDHGMWRPQVARFSRAGCRVIVPDLRGYGSSSVLPGTTTLDVFAADLVALLDHLGLDRVVVGGLSMGGQIAMEFAHQHPERLRGLLLADTFAQAETPEGRAFRNALADRLLREGTAGYADEVLTKMITPANAAALPEVAAHVLGMMRGAPPAGAAAALRGRALRRDYRATLPAVAAPTLVVVGAADEYTPVADAELIAGLVPGARLAVIPDAGHLPNLERPEEFNQHLGAFLANLGAIASDRPPHDEGARAPQAPTAR